MFSAAAGVLASPLFFFVTELSHSEPAEGCIDKRFFYKLSFLNSFLRYAQVFFCAAAQGLSFFACPKKETKKGHADQKDQCLKHELLSVIRNGNSLIRCGLME